MRNPVAEMKENYYRMQNDQYICTCIADGKYDNQLEQCLLHIEPRIRSVAKQRVEFLEKQK